jgi:hypothetical protein
MALLVHFMFMNLKKLLWAFVFGLLAQIPVSLLAQNNVLTQHNDINRSGWFNNEKNLNTRNVKLGGFGKLFARSVDDQIYAQPLVMQINLPSGQKNIVIVATVNNSLYAFDADSANVEQPYWQVNLTPSGSRVVRNTDMVLACGGSYRDFSGNMGIVGTPVIDEATQTLYVVARNLTNASVYQQYLHAIDVNTGDERANSPVLITATVDGSGSGNVNGKISFSAQKQNQRAGLLLLNNTVYIAWASHCDWGPYHGWVMGYDATTLQQKSVYNTTPDGYNGGIWMSGAGPSADESGNIYLAVGNGSVGKNGNNSDLTNRSESALKLTPSGSGLTVSSFFTPKNISDLEIADLDFGVTEVLLVPGTNRALVGCKDGKLYLLDRDNMGGFNINTNNVLQTVDLGTNAHLRSSFAYFKGSLKEFVYTWSENSLLKALSYDRGSNLFDLNSTISSGVQGPTGNNGALLSVSSNGSIDSTAVLWASHAANGDANQSVRPGILRALDANDVTKELWNSSIYANDDPGSYAKFNCPVIANGKVYLATFSNQLMVYGLLKSSTTPCNSGNISLNKSTTASSTSSGSAANAFDGDVNTQWVSGNGSSEYISVDLGARYDVCKINLKWGVKHGVNFSVQISDDNANWTSLFSVTGNANANLSFPVTGSGQFVRMNGTLGQGGYSLTEFEVLGSLSSSQCASPYLTPVTNIYENTATLNWSANGNNFVIQYKTVSAGSWSQVVSASQNITLSGLACSTDYLFRIRKACASDSSAYSSGSFSTLSCNQHCGPLPTRWSTQDIGDVDAAGSACFENGVYTLRGSGDDIWNTQDAFRFAYKTFVGDGDFSARVLRLDHSNEWNKVGIMIRESLTPGSRHAFIALTSGNGIAFQNRLQSNDISYNSSTGAGSFAAPYWLKLSKSGSVFTAYQSSDGATWTQIGNAVNAGFGNGTPVYAGLALTSHNNGVISIAALDNLFITGSFEYELQSFTASLNLNKSVSLQWTTTLESNVQSFVIERALNGGFYNAIDTVSAANQGRFTQKYSSVDPSVVSGMYYYRLKMVTSEGIVKYSAVANVFVSSLSAPLVYPNPAPATGGQTLTIAQGDENEPVKFVNIYDINGRLASKYTCTSTNGITEIIISGIPNGLYIVEVITTKSTYKTKVVIKN